MSEFNIKDFGENIKEYRKAKNFSQDNLADKLRKDRSTISKYETGELIPNAEDISRICDILEIYPNDLFEKDYKIQNKENNKNPFGTDTIYLYFNAYNYKTKKFGKDKFKLVFTEKPDQIRVDYYSLYDNKIYESGYMLADNCVAFMVVENYKSTSARLEVSEFVVNICNGVDNLMQGTYHGTNGQYIPSIRKCYFSKKNVEFTDKMFNDLKVSDDEMATLKEQNALYLDIFNN